jgi:hypothetical protein
MKITSEQLVQEISGFCGTEAYHKLTLSSLRATDGVAHLAKIAGAFWLIDAIGSYQHDDRIKHLGIQFWHLIVKDKKAELYVQEDLETPKLITQKIGYTDFPDGDWEFYVTDNVILLPSEY